MNRKMKVAFFFQFKYFLHHCVSILFSKLSTNKRVILCIFKSNILKMTVNKQLFFERLFNFYEKKKLQ
jgi:hypothetical protein